LLRRPMEPSCTGKSFPSSALCFPLPKWVLCSPLPQAKRKRVVGLDSTSSAMGIGTS
jgi:hypothetical protein